MKPTIIDGEGHVVERDVTLMKYLDEPFRSFDDLLNVVFFPSFDGWHRAARGVADGKGLRMPSPNVQDWLRHPFAQMIQLTSMVMNGVFERFPRLRVAFMHAGSGWVPFLTERLDREFHGRGAGLPRPPSE